jgi:hypothetical protein
MINFSLQRVTPNMSHRQMNYLVIYSDRRIECILPCQVPDLLSQCNDNWSVMRDFNGNFCNTLMKVSSDFLEVLRADGQTS